MPMPDRFKMTRRVSFADTDMAGIVHFSNYLRYMEDTEHAFLRSMDLSVHAVMGDITIGWPRVHVSCDFTRPLRFEDTVEIELHVEHIESKTIHYRFAFARVADDGSRETVATGHSRSICVRFPGIDGKPMSAMPIPAVFLDRIGTLTPDSD